MGSTEETPRSEAQDAVGDLDELALLTDDARRGLYDFVRAQRDAVTREEAAAATGLSRTLAAYHLDKLAQAGLLDVSYARANGRTGPGSGRPAKHYTRSQRDVAVSIPPRNYNLLARILATAADADPSPRLQAALVDAAAENGKSLGGSAEGISDALTGAGYEPLVTETGDIVLRNCPFHSLVHDHQELVCTLNHAFVQGALEGASDDPARAELSPCPGRCCVVVHPGAADAGQQHPGRGA